MIPITLRTLQERMIRDGFVLSIAVISVNNDRIRAKEDNKPMGVLAPVVYFNSPFSLADDVPLLNQSVNFSKHAKGGYVLWNNVYDKYVVYEWDWFQQFMVPTLVKGMKASAIYRPILKIN